MMTHSGRVRRSTALHAIATLGVALALGTASGHASASTLAVTGGAGLDGGALCPSGGFFCPTSPDLALSGSAYPVSGSFTYSPNALSFSLTLTEDVTFSGSGGSETLKAGSTFSGSDIAVSAPTGSGGDVSAANVADGAAETLYYVTSASSTTQQLNSTSLFVSSLDCQTVGPSQQCGLILGGAGANEIPVGAVGTQGYGGVLDFNVSVSPVPLPPAAWLLLSGLGGLVVLRRAIRARDRGALTLASRLRAAPSAPLSVPLTTP